MMLVTGNIGSIKEPNQDLKGMEKVFIDKRHLQNTVEDGTCP